MATDFNFSFEFNGPPRRIAKKVAIYCTMYINNRVSKVEADHDSLLTQSRYRTRAIITRSRFETALVYKPRILGLKNEEFPFLVHKLSAI